VLQNTEVHEGLSKRSTFPVKPKAVGVDEDEHLQERMVRILGRLKKFRFIGPFLKPVDAKEAPGYYESIKNPMSVQDIEQKLKGGQYKDFQNFLTDLNLIPANCQKYNHESSWYWKHAEKLQEFIRLFSSPQEREKNEKQNKNKDK
jgi:hypothetical protein